MRSFKCSVCGADSHIVDDITVKCDICAKVIPPKFLVDSEEISIRLPLCEEDGSRIREDGEPLWLVVDVAANVPMIDMGMGVSEEPVVCDRHYCPSCLASLVEQSILGIKSGAAWKEPVEPEPESAEEDGDAADA